jgi:alginate O-acetyltransferase complex protein AlgI
MLFNSLTFIVFFTIVFVLYQLPLPWKARKLQLVVASYLFYAAWNPPFVILIWISTLVDWFVAKRMHAATGKTSRRGLLILSLVTNLGLLGFFKYGEFLLENFQTLAASVGIQYEPAAWSIVLPVGISFYTFQTLSYTIDVYRRKIEPWKSPLDFALFVTFFPQLVAGPIVRAVDFLPQCSEPRRASGKQMGWGLSLLVIGLFEKVAIADALLAPIVDKIYSTDGAVSTLEAWCGTLAFSGQIFCDFAGYSTCAIGVALCLGFAIRDNFHFPYAAIGFSDFWRRWHISLSSWLRDYLYIPLGGNRQGPTRTQVNLMATMLLGGLWHGAAWTFVVWGCLHGLYLVVERMVTTVIAPSPFWRAWPVRMALALFTYALVCVTWVYFRAQTFSQAFAINLGMLGFDDGAGSSILKSTEIIMVLGVTGLMLALHWCMRDTTVEAVAERVPWWLRAGGLAACAMAIVTMAGDDRAFIYFQF